MTREQVEEQLKRINFNANGWGKSEISELPHVLMDDEEIEECVNGYYEAGFALLVATKDRVLLIDKKPLNYLTVEDIRFDMISEFDLHHRLIGAQVRINAGYKTMLFTSLNQARLRRLLQYVQTRMTQVKKDQSQHQTTQQQHLEEMNEQLRKYLMAAHKKVFIEEAEEISSKKSEPTKVPVEAKNEKLSAPAVPPPMWAATHDESAQATDPQPTAPIQPHHLTSQQDFEAAAAAAFRARTESTESTPIAQYIQTGSAHVQQPGAPATTQTIKDSTAPTPQQIVLAGARRVIPIISAYSKLPLLRRSPNGRPRLNKQSSFRYTGSYHTSR